MYNFPFVFFYMSCAINNALIIIGTFYKYVIYNLG